MGNNLSELQNKMLDMMKWFHEFCKQNNITYYAVGGTMLGAARHKGFIPWDDDIDVGVPRDDYNKILELAKTVNSSCNGYIIESYLDGNKDFEYPYIKIYDISTTLVENKRKKPKRGIFIDVFPLDGIGETKEEAINNYGVIKTKLDLLAARNCAIRKGRSIFKNLSVIVMGLLPDCIMGSQKLIKEIENECTSRKFDECKFVGNLVGNWRYKEIMDRKYFGQAILYHFEDMQIYGVQDYDNYLTTLYKNWRELPPIEKQKSEHDFIELDLHKSYLNKEK